MDSSIILKNALQKIGNYAVSEGLNYFKNFLGQKYGNKNEILEAIELLENDPESENAKELINKRLSPLINNDSETKKQFEILEDIVKNANIKNSVIQKAGGSSMQIGHAQNVNIQKHEQINQTEKKENEISLFTKISIVVFSIFGGIVAGFFTYTEEFWIFLISTLSGLIIGGMIGKAVTILAPIAALVGLLYVLWYYFSKNV